MRGRCITPVPAELTLFPGEPVGSGFGGHEPAPVRPQADLPEQRRQRGGRFLPVHRGADRGPHRWRHSGRHRQRVRPQLAPVRREIRAALPADIRSGFYRQRDRAHLFRRVRALQHPGALHLHHQPAGPQRDVAQHADHLHEPSGPDPQSGRRRSIEDPLFNPQYSTFCYTFQYMPGSTTYLDTPVVPSAAFAGPDQFPLDCEFPDGTPRIHSVSVRWRRTLHSQYGRWAGRS